MENAHRQAGESGADAPRDPANKHPQGRTALNEELRAEATRALARMGVFPFFLFEGDAPNWSAIPEEIEEVIRKELKRKRDAV